AAIPHRDFSGAWQLDRAASVPGDLGGADETLAITQNELTVECTAGRSRWIVPLDGSESKYLVGVEKWSSASKWEGSALLINTLVTGPRDYTIMDRWELSRDHALLTISRQVMHGTAQSEGRLVYRRQGAPMAEARAPLQARRPDAVAAPGAVRQYAVPAG